MRVKWAVLLISASPLLGPVNVSAQDPVTLSGSQLDGILPTYQLDPTQYQLRVAVDAVAVADPDRARNTLLTVDAEALEAQQMPGEEPEVRCTPARRALLASAGRSNSPGDPTSQQGLALTTLSAPPRQSATTEASRLAAATRDPAITGGAASPPQTRSVMASRSQPAAVSNAGSSGRQVGARSTRPAATASLGSSGRQVARSRPGLPQPRAWVERPTGRREHRPAATASLGSSMRRAAPDSNPPPTTTSAGAAGKRAPAAAVASRAATIEVPIRTVRSDNPSRSSGAGAVRAASRADASGIVARVRSQVSRALSAVPGGAFRLR